MTLHRFPNRQPAPSRPAGATCSGDLPSPGQGLDDSATLAALARLAENPTQSRIEEVPMPKPIDLPDHHEPRFLRIRAGGNLHLSWWQREPFVDRALLVMSAAVCVAALALAAWQVWP